MLINLPNYFRKISPLFFRNFSDIQKKSLYYRMGGEPQVFKVIEIFYDKVQADPSLMKYFRNLNVKKVVEHQKRLILVAFGGSSCISKSEIKTYHKGLKIDEHDFELIKSLMKESFEQLNIEKDDIVEALTYIENHKDLIVVETPFQLIGGEEGLKKVINYQYEKVLTDPEIRHFFLSTDIEKVKFHIANFLSHILGGSKKYTGQNLKEAHKNLELTDRHFYLMKKHLAWGLHKCNVNNAIIDMALDLIEKDRHNILNSKTTYEELGEDIGLKQIVDALFDKIMKNPMLKGLFKQENLEKTKESFYNFMAKELGGPNKYTGKDLKLAHAKLNLSDLQLDAFQKLIENVMKQRLFDPMIIRDVLWFIERYRRDICTVTVYNLVGGETFIEKGAIILQKKVKYHYKLAKFFKGLTDEQLTQLMRHLLTYSVGGRRAFRGRDMKSAHEHLYIREEHFKDMKHLVHETFKEFGIVDSLILQVMRIYDDKKRYVVSKEIVKKENMFDSGEDYID